MFLQQEPTQPEWRLTFRARITGQSTVGGLRRYTWIEQIHGGDGDTEDADHYRQGDSTSGWALELNNSDVANDTIVMMRFRGIVEGYPVYEFQASESATPSALSVTDVAGSKNYTNITELRFDEADGYVLSNPSAGVARFDFSGGGGSVTYITIEGDTTFSNVSTIQFPSQFWNVVQINPGTVSITPVASGRAKYESFFRLPGKWYFGGEPNNASRITFSASPGTPNLWRMYALPYLEARGGYVNAMACWLSTLGTDAQFRLGIYDTFTDDAIEPRRLVFDAGTVDASTASGSVGLKVLSSAGVRLEPHTLYWLVFIADYGTAPHPQIKVIDQDDCWNALGNDDTWTSNDADCGWYADLGAWPGDLPDFFPDVMDYIIGVGAQVGHVPAVALRYSYESLVEGLGEGALGEGAGAPADGGVAAQQAAQQAAAAQAAAAVGVGAELPGGLGVLP